MSHRTSLLDVFSRLGRPRVLVVGDAMLDRYIEGEVTRLSPEAPVPVLRVKRERGCPGGAANTAGFLAALGCQVTISSVVGDDRWGDDLRTMLFQQGVDISSLWRAPGRQTICKQRLLSTSGARQYQHLLRLDYEPAARPADTQLRSDLLADAERLLEDGHFDVVAFSDYRKHALPEELQHFWLEQERYPVVVDGKPHGNYYGADLLMLNQTETETELGVKLTDVESYTRAAEQLRRMHTLQAALVTLGPNGMALAQHGKPPIHLAPSERREVYDVTGAGDMVLAVLAWGLGSGLTIEEVLPLAQRSALWEVERMGCVPLERAQLERELRGPRRNNIISLDEAARRSAAWQSLGHTVAFTNGCFDLGLHAGHLSTLRFAAQQADLLFVGVNGDASVHRLKGDRRPYRGEQERAELLADLEYVDYVTIFEGDTPTELIRAIQPNVLVKGGDSGSIESIPGHDLVPLVLLAPVVETDSTTQMAQKVQQSA